MTCVLGKILKISNILQSTGTELQLVMVQKYAETGTILAASKSNYAEAEMLKSNPRDGLKLKRNEKQ